MCIRYSGGCIFARVFDVLATRLLVSARTDDLVSTLNV
jgi:hypothetical protein